MDPSKVIVFGSFTEDEIRTLHSKPSEKSGIPVGKNELQFGSLPLLPGTVLSGANVETVEKVTSAKSSNLVKKDVGLVHLKDIESGSGDIVKENGSIHSSEQICPQTNGMKQIKDGSPNLVSTCLSESVGAGLSQQFLSPSQVGQDFRLKESYSNGVHDASAKLVPLKDDMKKASNGSIATTGGLLPRGLINAGNLCFLNATLQALLSCSPFLKLLQELRIHDIHKVDYPTLAAFVDFVSEFDMPHGSSSKTKDPSVVETGWPFSPAMFESVVKNFTPDLPSGFSGRSSRQEDAQEFLSFVMDRMHDELLKLGGQVSGVAARKLSLVSSSEDDEWETVGPKNKSAVTRTQSFVPSELSEIFGGQLRSVVKAKGNKDSATVQPYLLLHLDIIPDVVQTIEDALHKYCAAEALEGYRASNTKAGVVNARKSVKIQTLSKIMILHLMRFSYGNGESTKVHKPVHFPLELVLSSQLLVSPLNEGRKYKLVATITHHGREPSKGHYTADALYPDGQWLRFDDASVTPIPTSKVLHDQAYVLFYKQV